MRDDENSITDENNTMPPGSVAINGRIVYQIPASKNTHKIPSDWKEQILSAVDLPLNHPSPESWWLNVRGTGMHLGHLIRSRAPTWKANDFREMAITAAKLEKMCKRYVDYSRDPDCPAFFLIGDLEVISTWAKQNTPRVEQKKGAPKKNGKRWSLERIGLLFRESFGQQHAVSGTHEGPFVRFVIALLKVIAGQDVRQAWIRETLRDRNPRGVKSGKT